MTDLQTQLRAIAEQLTGAPLFVDVTWLVSASAGTTREATGDTAEEALARFIADLLQDDPARLTRVAPPVSTAPAPPIPTPAAAPLPPAASVQKRGANTSAVGAANRARIADLLAQGLDVRAIADQTGMPYSTVYGHAKALREAAGANSTEAQPANGNGFRSAD